MNLPKNIKSMAMQEVVERIARMNERMRHFCERARGWTAIEAAELLSRARMDWQVSLSKSLQLWIREDIEKSDGSLILAWVNLGSLVEGSMKWFLSVYYDQYREDAEAIRSPKGDLVDPDSASAKFERLRQFFERRIWETNKEEFQGPVLTIQKRRNAIHAYRDRDIGTFQEYEDHVRFYLAFLRSLDERVPYPSDVWFPSEEEPHWEI